MSGGAFLISRELFKNELWQDVTKFRIFFYILGNAVFSEEGVKKGGVFIGRGQWLRSYRNLRDDLEYSDNNTEKRYSTATIKRKTDELVEEGRIQKQETRLGTLFTVVNYDLYQDFDTYRGKGLEQQRNSNETATKQQRNNNNNVNNVNKDNINTSIVEDSPDNKEKPKETKYKFDENHMLLAKFLLSEIRKNNGDYKEPNLKSWANTFRLMVERDSRTLGDIKSVIIWCQNDDFWQTNILSAKKLRKQFDQLKIKMDADRKRFKGGRRGFETQTPKWLEQHEHKRQEVKTSVEEVDVHALENLLNSFGKENQDVD